MEIRILGCSGGIGKDLRTTCLQLGGHTLIDCGTGIGDLALDRLEDIRHIFITHSHLDHVAGLPLLVDTIYAQLTETPLTIHCLPATYEALSKHIFNDVIWPDFFSLPNQHNPVLRCEIMEPGDEVVLDGFAISMLSVSHTVPAAGYQIRQQDTTVVFSGDTTSAPSFWRQLNQCNDLSALIIECAFVESEAHIANVAMHYHPSLLAKDLRGLDVRPHLYISHLQPGRELETMQQLRVLLPEYRISAIHSGDILSL